MWGQRRGARGKIPAKRPRVRAGSGWGVEGWLEGDGGGGVRALAERALVSLTLTSAFSAAGELELVLSQSDAISASTSGGSPSQPAGSHKAAGLHPSRGGSPSAAETLHPGPSRVVVLHESPASAGGPPLGWFRWILPVLHFSFFFFPVTPQRLLGVFGNTGQKDTPEMLSLTACCFQQHFILCCLHSLTKLHLKKQVGFDLRPSDLKVVLSFTILIVRSHLLISSLI